MCCPGRSTQTNSHQLGLVSKLNYKCWEAYMQCRLTQGCVVCRSHVWCWLHPFCQMLLYLGVGSCKSAQLIGLGPSRL
jgi:hypothetical protein